MTRLSTRVPIAGLSGSRALSWQVWLFGAVAPEMLLFVLGNYPAPLLAALAISFSAVISAPLILIPGRFLLPRLTTGWSRLVTVLTAYAVTAIAIPIGVIVAISSQHPVTHITEELLGGFIFHAWFFAIASELVNDRFFFAESVKRLSKIRAQLQTAASWQEESLVMLRQTELERLKHQLQTNALLDRSENEQLIRTLLAHVETLDSREETLRDITIDPLTKRPYWRSVFRAMFIGDVSAAIPAAFFVATTWMVTGMGMHSWSVAIFSTLLNALAVLGLLTLATKFVLPRFTDFNPVFRAILAIGVFILISFLAGIAPLLVSGLPSAALFAITLQTTLVLFVMSLTLAFKFVAERLSQDGKNANDILERKLLENAQAMRLFRDRLSQFIHRDLQAVIVSMTRKSQENPANDGEQRQDLSRQIDGLLLRLESQLGDSFVTTPDQTIAELSAVWGKALRITAQWSPEAKKAVDSNPISQSTVSALLLEIVTNTAKHDGATNVLLEISLLDGTTIFVRSKSWGPESTLVRSATQVRMVSERKGMGSRLFDEVCLSWALHRNRNVTSFEAIIPLLSGVTSSDEGTIDL